MKRALITGVSGQDGSYLAELLVEKGYEVHGVIRRASSFNTARVDHLYERGAITLHHGDVIDGSSLREILERVKPDEIYHLASQSHVRVSFDQPEYTADTTGLGAIRLFEAARKVVPAARIYNAASSEMFGSSAPPQNERTPFCPRSPYACAKVFAYNIARNYREAYGQFIASGILFNHESERRGETFVTRKITRAVGRIVAGRQTELRLGNLDAKRDWGHAKDYVQAMWLMLQRERAEDFVIGTGESHSVSEFCKLAFGVVGLEWEGYVRFDDRYVRPSEVDDLRADASAAFHVLGWWPTCTFGQLVRGMVEADVELAKRER
jgi:GDPmannose 4,6-dehydratase